MNTKSTRKLLITLLIVLVATQLTTMGCERIQAPTPSSPGELSPALVPNTLLDVYVYAQQDSPTIVPARMVNLPHDIEVKSVALWGVPADDEFAIGIGLSLTNTSAASELYAEIDLEELYAQVDLKKEDGWKMLSGNTIYLVHGSGAAAECLKTAISNHDFRYCDDGELLEGLTSLPTHGRTKRAAIALVKPTQALIAFVAPNATAEDLQHTNTILKLVDPKIVSVGLYSPGQIDIGQIVETVESDGSISNLDVGLLASLKSGLPGFVVEPAVNKLLTDSEFTEMKFGEFTLYTMSWHTYKGETIPLLVWVDGNYIFAAMATQESYAETLISSAIARRTR